MGEAARPVIETRSDQMFPTLAAGGDRAAAPLRRGARLPRGRAPGRDGRGQSGHVRHPGRRGRDHPAQRARATRSRSSRTVRARSWASWPSSRAGRRWSTRVAAKAVEALVIPSARLRDVLVAEAELGERIMRALILRRVGLLEGGVGGPVIVGRADDGDVLRLAGFLARNGHPHQTLDPDTDSCAQTLLERFQRRAVRAADRALPERAAAAQPERGRARALHRPRAADRSGPRSTTSRSSAPDRRASPRRSTRRPRGSR